MSIQLLPKQTTHNQGQRRDEARWLRVVCVDGLLHHNHSHHHHDHHHHTIILHVQLSFQLNEGAHCIVVACAGSAASTASRGVCETQNSWAGYFGQLRDSPYMCSGVRPRSDKLLTLAPALAKCLMTSTWPLEAALNRGVLGGWGTSGGACVTCLLSAPQRCTACSSIVIACTIPLMAVRRVNVNVHSHQLLHQLDGIQMTVLCGVVDTAAGGGVWQTTTACVSGCSCGNWWLLCCPLPPPLSISCVWVASTLYQVFHCTV